MMTPFAIIGTQRSGTTFLRRSLDDHPDIVCHGELFRPAHVESFHSPALRAAMPGKQDRDAAPVAYLDRLLSFYLAGFVGFKLLLAHSPAVLEEIARRRYRLIVLQRENALAKYSSLMIFLAMSDSGDRFRRPANEGPDAVKATFDGAEFDKYRRGEADRWAAFRAICQRYEPPRCELEYDEMAWGDGLGMALDFLGAPRRLLDAGIVKQNSADIISRFGNPDNVRDYLNRYGLERWAIEGPEPIAGEMESAALG